MFYRKASPILFGGKENRRFALGASGLRAHGSIEMRKIRVTVGIALGILCAGVLAQVIASACSASTTFSLSSKAGPPGSQVSAFGAAFAKAPVDIYWASDPGPLLATAQGPDFPSAASPGTVTITIPVTAEPGLYYVYATDNTGPITDLAVPFTVTSAPPVKPTPTDPPAAQQSGNQTTTPSSPASPANGPVAVPNVSAAPADSVMAAAPASDPAPVALPVAPTDSREQLASRPAFRPEYVSPPQIPSLATITHGTLVPSGPPAPIVLGLVLAGLAVLAAAGFAGTVLVRRRRALAASSDDKLTG